MSPNIMLNRAIIVKPASGELVNGAGSKEMELLSIEPQAANTL